MKHLILPLFFSLITTSVFGQQLDTLYFDAKGRSTVATSDYTHYHVKYTSGNSNQVYLRQYTKDGALVRKFYFSNYADRVKQGADSAWYDTGELKSVFNYSAGKLHGDVKYFWQNGQLKRQDKFEEGAFISGTIWNEQGKEEPYRPYFIEPQFRGGVDELMTYLQSHVVYPRKAKKKGIEGKVLVDFIVETDGSISNIKIKKSVHKLLDNEAIRVIEGMPDWKPGSAGDEPVRVSYTLPINFILRR